MASRSFAFVFPMASGHINPSLPVARALIAQGHDVHYLSNKLMREAIEDTGAHFHEDAEVEPELYQGRESDLFGCLDSLKKDYGLESDDPATAMLKLKVIQLEMQMPGVIRWLKKVGAHAVAYCPMLNVEGAYAAKALGIPSVAIMTTAGPGSLPRAYQEFIAMFGATQEGIIKAVAAYEPQLEAAGRLNRTYGLDLDVLAGVTMIGKLEVLRESATTLVTTSEDLQDPMDDEMANVYRQEGVVFEAVGALLDGQGAKRAGGHSHKATAALEHGEKEGKPAHVSDTELLDSVRAARAAGRRVIFGSMGTVVTGDSPEVGWEGRPTGPDGNKRGLTGREICQAAWAGLFDAFGAGSASEGPLIVMALGPQENALGDVVAPPNAICVPVVPQVDLLKAGVDLFLTHGGQNSFTESLSIGVPVVVCPGFGDQPVNARKAVNLGVGLQVPRPDPDAGEEASAAARYRAAVCAALSHVATEPSFSEAAGACAERLARAGGVPRAVEVMLGVANNLAAKEHTVNAVDVPLCAGLAGA